MKVKISDIKINQGRREVSVEKTKELAGSIKEIGLLNPITIKKDNTLIAGYHRLKACQMLGMDDVECSVVDIEGLMAELAEIDENLIRNELHYVDRGEQLKRRKEIHEELHPETRNGQRNGQTSKKTDSVFLETPSFVKDTSSKTGRSETVIKEELQIAQKITPEVKEIIKEKDITKTDALRLARMDQEQQIKVAEVIKNNEAKNVQQATQMVRRQEIKVNPIELPEGKYDVILADPPWKYEFSETESRAIENQYPTMDLDSIKKLEVPSDDNSVLLLWTTAPKLEEGIEVLKAWGYEYKTCAIWDKEMIGMGYWFRSQHELLLVGVKGSFRPPEPSDRFSSVIREKRERHSKKPDVIYDMVEKMFPNGKYLEMFARQKHNDKWSVWGNQI